MSLSVELTKNGKPNIIVNNFKYRESHSLKSGEITWRCLGRSCSATVRTDINRTLVTASNGRHSGPHPVTMRSLSSPQQHSRTSTPTVTEASSAAAQHSPDLLTAPTPPACYLAVTPLTSQESAASGLAAENGRLKEEIKQLSEQLKCVLDHSIESDTRLLQFTNEVFVATTPRAEATVHSSAVDCAVQCDLPTVCVDARCEETRALVNDLRTTIEVLEAEVQCIQAETDKCNCKKGRSNSTAWTIIRETKRNPLPLKNRFDRLCVEDIAVRSLEATRKEQKSVVKKRKKSKNYPYVNENSHRLRVPVEGSPPLSKRYSTRFPVVVIESDSHGRHLAGLIQDLVTPQTRVSGFCRPGAGLLTVTSGSSLPPGGCAIIIAGTNDVADGRSQTIYQHIESCITDRIAASKVIVATLPHRHDLPTQHPINDEIEFINAYIAELGARYQHVNVLDFNAIPRHYFTGHGMHLRWRGKHLLARLIVDCMVGGLQQPVIHAPDRPSSEASLNEVSDTPVQAFSHVTYADAVKLAARGPGLDKQTSSALSSPPTEFCSKTRLFNNNRLNFLDTQNQPRRIYWRPDLVTAAP